MIIQLTKELVFILPLVLVISFLHFFYFKDKKFIRYFLLISLLWIGLLIPNFYLYFFYSSFIIWIFIYDLSLQDKIAVYFILFSIGVFVNYQRIDIGLHIMNLTFFMMINLIILIPLTIYYLEKNKLSLKKYDLIIILFLLLKLIISIRDFTLTVWIREEIFHTFINIVLPYFCITRMILISDIKQKIIPALSYISTIYASISLFEFVKRWDVLNYSLAFNNPLPNIYFGGNFRFGFLRADSIFNNKLGYVSFLLIVSVFILYYYYENDISRKRYAIFSLSFIFLGLCTTVSLSGILFFILTFIIIYTLKNFSQKNYLKLVTFLSIFSILFISILLVFSQKGGAAIDYRVELLQKGLTNSLNNPFLGSNTFKYDEIMELKSGTLDFDLTNGFLIILMKYGFLGLGSFLLIWYFLMRKLRSLFHKGIYFQLLFTLNILLFFITFTISFIDLNYELLFLSFSLIITSIYTSTSHQNIFEINTPSLFNRLIIKKHRSLFFRSFFSLKQINLFLSHSIDSVYELLIDVYRKSFVIRLLRNTYLFIERTFLESMVGRYVSTLLS